MAQLQLNISGMSCGHCVQSVRKALTSLPGVEIKNVEVGRAEVDYDPAQVQPAQIVSAIDRQGFQAHQN